MTDKQIIIHEVDVSRCMFFNKEYEEDNIQIKNFCEWQFVSCQEFDCAKCYFKNWKRKEQECERLKLIVAHSCHDVLYEDSLRGQLDQLKAENEELKKSILQECPNCGEEYLNYKGVELYYENYDLKQTLSEIKKIAEYTIDMFDEGLETGGTYDRVEQILQKCEVEDE